MDHLLAIRVFTRVVEAGTFTRAAESLGMPKPTVTKLVQSLESHLQTRLLNRTTRRISVTSDGAAYYERTVRLLNELEEIEAGVGRARVNPRGRLRVDLSSSIANLIVLPSLPDFRSRYPDVQLELGISDRPVDLIGDNVDCAIRAGALGDAALVARRIGEMGWLTCASPDYLQRHGLPAHPLELETNHVIVAYALGSGSRIAPLRFNRGGEQLELRPPAAVTANEGYACIVAALAGMGIVQTPRFMVQLHVDQGGLVPLLQDWSAEPLPIHVVYPQNRQPTAKLRVFVNWVAELFARQPHMQR